MNDPFYSDESLIIFLSISVVTAVSFGVIAIGTIWDKISNYRYCKDFLKYPGWNLKYEEFVFPCVISVFIAAMSIFWAAWTASNYMDNQDKLYKTYSYTVAFEVDGKMSIKAATNKEPVIKDNKLHWTLPDGTEVYTTHFSVRRNEVVSCK